MRVNVWIRKENEQAWQDMANKSEWLNEMLVRETTPLPNMPRISKPKTEILKDIEKNAVKDPQPYRPTHYKPTDDWGA